MFYFRAGSIIVYSTLQLEPYRTISDLSLVLYDVSVNASNSRLGGQGNSAATVVVETQGTNHTGMYMTKQFETIFVFIFYSVPINFTS